MKILLVEDNVENRDALSRRLLRRGYEIAMAFDGAQAVAMATTETPDVILMDMSLPVLDGWEATKRIRSAPNTASVPIIALTAHAMSGDRDRAMAAGCDGFHTKPIEFPRLLDLIESVVRNKQTV